ALCAARRSSRRARVYGRTAMACNVTCKGWCKSCRERTKRPGFDRLKGWLGSRRRAGYGFPYKQTGATGIKLGRHTHLMTKASAALSRRNSLRGIGTLVALPALESLPGARAMAAATGGKSPVRMGFFFVPNGVHMPDWTPTGEGADFQLPWTLQ